MMCPEYLCRAGPGRAVALAVVAIAHAGGPGGVCHADVSVTFADRLGDALVRRTGVAPAMLPPAQNLPDLLSVTVSGWQPTSPTTDRFVGVRATGASALFVRVDVVVNGLVNPPGSVGVGGQTYNPYQFGPSPLFGFIEFDIDRNIDTGGELPSAAWFRTTANVARFGAVLPGALAGRTLLDGLASVSGTPGNTGSIEYCRSGTDFALALCGCTQITVLSGASPSGALTFGPGDTWVVRGRFFQRSGGYAPAASSYGGTGPGHYDPLVPLRFSHDVVSDRTTVSLVYPLRQAGAGQLAGRPAQAINGNCADDTSVQEAVADLVSAAATYGNAHTLTWQLIHNWSTAAPEQALDPTLWTVKAVVGAAYSVPSDGLYIWTDVGFGLSPGDVTGDGHRNVFDLQAIHAAIATRDGSPTDEDQTVNGRVDLIAAGWNFSVYDVNGDGVIDQADAAGLAECPADVEPDGTLNVLDVFAFLAAWFASGADFNGDGVSSASDIFAFLEAWFAGCP
jgi:hypothetical protein